MPRRRPVEIVNRTTDPLDVMYDGVPEIIEPGYKIVDLPGGGEQVIGAGPIVDGEATVRTHACDFYAAEAFKRQHPLMGSQNPHSVDARDTIYLLGVPEWGDEFSALEQSEADELLDRTMLPGNRQAVDVVDTKSGQRQPAIIGHSARTKSARIQKEARKKRAKAKAQAQEQRRSGYAREHAHANPTGLKTNYPDLAR